MCAEKTVGSFFGKEEDIRTYKEDERWVLPTTMIGVEIELEGFNKYPKFNGPAYWEQKEDGSLRHIDGKIPIEFVFSAPLCGYDLTKALSLFKETMQGIKPSPIASPRASTHVHLDVREFSFSQLLNLLVTYTIVERPLYKFCGIHREENNFCLPFYKAEASMFDQLCSNDILTYGEKLAASSAGSFRYNGMNICALRKFGTIEFRHLPGTIDVDLISTWINIVMCLKKAAIEYSGNLLTLPTQFSEAGIRTKVRSIFNNYFKYIDYPELEYDVLRGIRLAQDILYRRDKELAKKDISTYVYKEEDDESSYVKDLKKEFKIGKTKNKKDGLISASRTYTMNFGFIEARAAAEFANDVQRAPVLQANPLPDIIDDIPLEDMDDLEAIRGATFSQVGHIPRRQEIREGESPIVGSRELQILSISERFHLREADEDLNRFYRIFEIHNVINDETKNYLYEEISGAVYSINYPEIGG